MRMTPKRQHGRARWPRVGVEAAWRAVGRPPVQHSAARRALSEPSCAPGPASVLPELRVQQRGPRANENHRKCRGGDEQDAGERVVGCLAPGCPRGREAGEFQERFAEGVLLASRQRRG